MTAIDYRTPTVLGVGPLYTFVLCDGTISSLHKLEIEDQRLSDLHRATQKSHFLGHILCHTGVWRCPPTWLFILLQLDNGYVVLTWHRQVLGVKHWLRDPSEGSGGTTSCPR